MTWNKAFMLSHFDIGLPGLLFFALCPYVYSTLGK